MSTEQYIEEFLNWVREHNEDQPEYLQAVSEVVADIAGEVDDNPNFARDNVLYYLAEPDRVITFRVSWLDDSGVVRVNRGWRVQHSGLIGPYKGGLRFHTHVNLSVLKFLAFEQTFKNALTGLSIGGAKGGADFDPRNASSREVMRFCQAFMNELYRHIGPNTDVPAGDINVGKREIGYLFGQYRRLVNQFNGTLTGKPLEFGGSHVRVESTGYGLIYFLAHMLGDTSEDILGKSVAISGAGNVALHAAAKAASMGARVVSLSCSKGTLSVPEGMNEEKIRSIIGDPRNSMDRLLAVREATGGVWIDDRTPWHLPCDIALPSATQNELGERDAQDLVSNGCKLVAEGANMPCTEGAIRTFEKHQVRHAPGKASNAGGVAVSVLEMTQNASFKNLSYSDLDDELKAIMKRIHQQCVDHGREGDHVNYRRGANIAAFRRLSTALIGQGIG